MNEESLFHDALSRSPAERAAFLEQACAGRPEIRVAVEGLLAAHERSRNLLDQPPVAPREPVESGPGPAQPDGTGDYHPQPAGGAPRPSTASEYEPRSEPGAVIAGRYTLQERIGEGGMGEVWVAKQTEPVKRKVALKLIKAGMDAKAVLQRFEAERQALALMDHPNIARVLDGGMTSDRRPFFVMELVNGLPLTTFCDEGKLGIRERLELFVGICQAVQHAHQKGIIHRDLKPSNILVTLIDARPVPKVIDFGVAKAIGGKLLDESLSTQFGSVVGTLEYMAPEQAGYSGTDIDTRADIYSLGVILYELFTGLRPYDGKRLRKAALSEMIRIIQEEEPSKPSTRISTDESLPSLAALRQTEPKRLLAILRGELDWVVMKCLDKQRDRRYETAIGLARDLQRYLSDEPVEACPPSATYRLRKFAKKNRAALTTTAAIAALLIFGITVSAWQAVRATRAEGDARISAEAERLAKQDAEKAAAAEKQANEQSQRRLAQIEKGNEILTSIFADLDIRNVPAGTEPVEAVLAKRLVKAAEQLEGEAVGDPLVVAHLQHRLGLSLVNLGHPAEALELFLKARATYVSGRGAEQVDTLVATGSLAQSYRLVGTLGLALPLFEETQRLMEAHLGVDHPETIRNMMNLALCYAQVGKADRALPLFEAAVKYRKARLGTDHPDTLTSMNNLANCYQAVGKSDLALALAEETLKLMKANLGPDHHDTLMSINTLAFIHWRARRLDLAVPLFEESLTLHRAKMGSDHPRTITAMNNLASGYRNAGQWERALPLFEEAAAGVEKRRFQLEDAERITTSLLQCLERLRQFEKAEAWHRKWLAVVKERAGGDSRPYADVLVNLGMNLLNQKKWGEAETALRDCLAIREQKAPDDWRTFYTQSMLGASMLGQKKYAEAEPRLLKGYEGLKQREETIPKTGGAELRIPEAVDRLIELYTATNKPDDVKKWLTERAKYPDARPPRQPK